MSVYANENPTYLRQSLVSMATQTIPPDEMVLVIDGPIPSGLECVIADFAAEVPFEVHLIRLAERSGTGSAVAQGMLACRNELVARMDSDDIVTCDRMEKTLAAFAAHPELGIVGTQAVEFVGSPDNVTSVVDMPQRHDDIVAFSKRRIPFRQPSVTLRKSEVLAAGNYDGNFPYFEDYDLFNRMLAHGSKALNLPDICLFVRVGESFYGRRGGRAYLGHVVRFKLAQYESGYFSAADLACSLPPHIAVCLLPNSLRTWVYDTLLRKQVPALAPSESTYASTSKSALVYSESWDVGGIETLFIDIVRMFEHAPIDFTLFAPWKRSDTLDKRLKELHVTPVFLFDEKRPRLQRCIAGWKRFEELLEQHPYDIVHINTSNGLGLMYAPIAKMHGVPIIIAHSHGSRFDQGTTLAKSIVHTLGQTIGIPATTRRIACSHEAGRHLFGNHSFEVLRHGYDPTPYSFDPTARDCLRNKLGIAQSTFVVGHIGRITAVKNPLFQIRLFAAFHERIPDSTLLAIGIGELREQRDAEIARLGLSDCTIMLDATPNPGAFYSAMDCFILPSRSEGLPNVAIEAQIAGLPVLMSASITDEACITDLARRLPADAGEQAWADALVELYNQGAPVDRSSYAAKIEQTEFSLSAMKRHLMEAYGL